MRLTSRRKNWLLFTMILVVVGLGSTALWFRVRSRRPSILLITLDTTRADRLGTYGDPRAKTPCLDKLAAEGVLFENALTHVPLTLPSHATMLTGLLPPEHGLHSNAMGKLPSGIPTLSEQFSSADYRKGAFLASFVLDRQFGLNRGFDVYDDDFAGDQAISEAAYQRRREGGSVIDKALAWLQKDRKAWSWLRRPYLCWIHLYDPHLPYSHTKKGASEFAGRPYDAEINYVDGQLQRLFDTLRQQGELENTLIVVVGDHGEGLGEHAEMNHGQQLYQSTLHVPLIIHWPSGLAGSQFVGPRRVPETVGLVDLSPTLLELLGKPPLENISGRSLLPAFQGKPLPAQLHFAETFEGYFEIHSSPQRALVDEGWKYIQSRIPELYHLTDDPKELKNLVAVETEQAEKLRSLLIEKTARMKAQKAEETVVDAKTLERLKQLGYTGGKDLPKDEAFSKFPDIKELLPAYNRVNEALQLRELGQFDNAERLLATAVKEQPVLSVARLFLAETLAQQAMTISDNPQRRSDKFEQAVDACNALIAQEQKMELPGKEQTWEVYLIKGGALSELGRNADAEAAYSFAEKLQPKNAKVQTQVGMGRLKKPELRTKAITNLETAIMLDKELFLVHLVLGKFYLEQDRIDEALVRFQSAAKYNPKLLEAHMLIAQIFATRQQWTEAVKQVEQAVAAAPQDPRLRQLLEEFRRQQKQQEQSQK